MTGTGSNPHEKGNALFIILIGIVLFAALAYAVTQSGKGSMTIDKEQAVLDASKIVQQAGLIEQTVVRLRLTNGCTDTQISFENSVVAGYENPNAPTDKSCHVFDPAGGGLSWSTPPASTGLNEDYSFSGLYVFEYANVWDAADLVMFLYITSPALCMEINRKLGLPTDMTTLAQDNEPNYAHPSHKFTGVYPNPPGIGFPDDGGDIGPVREKMMGCYKWSAPGKYVFYSVLIPRY